MYLAGFGIFAIAEARTVTGIPARDRWMFCSLRREHSLAVTSEVGWPIW
jgi:hypothetical protein